MRCLPLALILGLISLPASAEQTFRLGVQTHFEQGWPVDLIDRAKDLGATLLRDEIAWGEVETNKGSYDFAPADRYLARMRAAGMQLQLVTMDGNAFYDSGMTPHSATGQQAYADYLAALTRQFGDAISEIELGNEVNSGEFLRGPYADAPAVLLARQARVLRRALGPDVRMICAGTNAIAIGFLREFFRRGGLAACDGISVHPYREHPETLDLDLDRLKALMREMGGEKPIHATEFGLWTEDPAASAPYMLKMVAILSAAGVVDAIWYALVDEPYWPNMGLLGTDGAEKPAAAAFRLLQTRLLPLGRATDLSPSRQVRIYRFGSDAYLLWGSGGAVQITGVDAALNAQGDPVPLPTELGDQPVILFGPAVKITLPPGPAHHDSLYEYNTPPWSYFARRPGIGLTPLEIIDDRWGSYRSAPDLAPLRISDEWLTTARFAEGPFHAVERFTAPASGRYELSGWWESGQTAPASVLILRQGEAELARLAISGARVDLPPQSVDLKQGETLDFELAPGEGVDTSAAKRRIRIRGPIPKAAAGGN